MTDTEKGRMFRILLSGTSLDDFRRYAEHACKLKKFGTVMVDITNMALRREFNLNGVKSSWHEYIRTLPTLLNFFPHPDLAPYMPKNEAAINKDYMLERVDVLREFELKASALMVEPNFWPEGFFRKRPDLRGPRTDHPRRGAKEVFAPCVDKQEVLDIFEWMMCEFKKDVPELEQFTFRCNDLGSGVCWSSGLYTGFNGPSHCQHRNPAMRIRDFLNVLHSGAKKGGGDIRITFNGNFYNNEVYTFMPNLPANTWLEGWHDDSVTIHRLKHTPIVGVFNPLDIAATASPINISDKKLFNVSLYCEYRRGNEPLDTVEKIIDVIEDVFSNPISKLHQIHEYLFKKCVEWVGEKLAAPLYAAFFEAQKAMDLRSVGYGSSEIHLMGLTMRHITRPLVFRPEILTEDEESYFLPHVFNISNVEARMDYMDMHGSSIRINPVLIQSAPVFEKAGRKIFEIGEEAKVDWLKKLGCGLHFRSCAIRSTCNFSKAQEIREKCKMAVEHGPHLPEKKGSDFGEPGYIEFNEIMRNEMDNAVEMLSILERGGDDILLHAKKAEDENEFEFGPDIKANLKMKIEIMKKYWRDIEAFIAPPHR